MTPQEHSYLSPEVVITIRFRANSFGDRMQRNMKVFAGIGLVTTSMLAVLFLMSTRREMPWFSSGTYAVSHGGIIESGGKVTGIRSLRVTSPEVLAKVLVRVLDTPVDEVLGVREMTISPPGNVASDDMTFAKARLSENLARFTVTIEITHGDGMTSSFRRTLSHLDRLH